MNCPELHCYLENPMRSEVYVHRETLPEPVVEHLSACEACSQLFEQQRELGSALGTLRDSCQWPSATLDAKVLAAYRQQISEAPSSSAGLPWMSPRAWFALGAAATAIAAAMFFFFGKPATDPAPNGNPVHAQSVRPSQALPKLQETDQRGIGSAKAGEKATSRVEGAPPLATKRRARTITTANRESPLPDGFASLMYCDDFSCSGAMEVIRVQLPASEVDVTPVSSQRAVPTMAEVLVGSDGIARGIRIVR